MNNHYYFLRFYSIVLKLLSVFSLFNGCILSGFMIYIWSRFTAFYDVVRTAWRTFATSLQGISGSVTPIRELPPIPLWPLLLLVIQIIMGGIILALTLWAIGQWIDFRLSVAEEESQMRATQLKALNAIAHDISSVAGYLTSLPMPRVKTRVKT